MANILAKNERINDYYIVKSIPFTSYAEAELNLNEYFLKLYPNQESSYEIFRYGSYWYVCERW